VRYIRRRELEDHFGGHERAPGNIPPPQDPNPFNPPPGQPNPFSPAQEQPNPFEPSPEQPNPFIDPSEPSNQLYNSAPSASNYPTRSNPIPIPSSGQPRHPSFDPIADG
ncbi:hypothetical protein EDD17DRAFT_1630807, partial [Pisolithus thermaeus]